MGDSNLNQYQYWGLVGQSVSKIGSSIAQGYASSSAHELMSGGYAMSADAMDLQAEQELINAQFSANVRMEKYNQSEAANVAITTAMGKTGENSTISDANRYAAEQDANLMKREGKMRNISARSAASSARSKAKQEEIAADSAYKQGIAGAVGSLGLSIGAFSMLG